MCMRFILLIFLKLVLIFIILWVVVEMGKNIIKEIEGFLDTVDRLIVVIC